MACFRLRLRSTKDRKKSSWLFPLFWKSCLSVTFPERGWVMMPEMFGSTLFSSWNGVTLLSL